MNFTINPDFERLIPPLSQDERAGLEALILANGIQSPLIIARYPSPDGEEMLHLADGHNRYRIAEKHGLKYNTITQDFASEDDVVIWMIDNQKGRRNLTDFVKFELRKVKEERLKKKGREKQKETLGGYKHQSVLSIIDKTENDNPHNTQREIAADLNWSTGKVAQTEVVFKKAPEEIKQKLRTGELSTNQVYNKIKQEEKTKALKQAESEKTRTLTAEVKNEPTIHVLPAVQFLSTIEPQSVDLILTDPPYITEYNGLQKFETFIAEWLPALLSKLKPTGRAFICTGAYPGEMHTYLKHFMSERMGKGLIVDAPLIWTYRNTLGQTPKMKYNLNYQLIWHIYTEQSTPLDTSITNEMFSVQDINAPDGRQGTRYHAWQKPDELANRLVRHASKPGDTVLDCFACTGAFLIAAAKAGRTAIGCEINPDNAKIAEERGCKIIG